MIRSTLLFIILSLSCKSLNFDRENRNKSDSNFYDIHQIPKFSLKSDEFVMYELCKQDGNCSLGFDSGNGQFLLPIDKSYKKIVYKRCNIDACSLISEKSIDLQNERPLSNEIFSLNQDIDVSLLLAAQHVNSHIANLKKCSEKKMGSEVAYDEGMNSYARSMLNYDRPIVKNFLALKKFYNRELEEDNVLVLRNVQDSSQKEGLSLSSAPNYRVQIYSFQPLEKSGFYEYYKANRTDKRGRAKPFFENITHAFATWLQKEGGNHSALIIEKKNTQGIWAPVRYVSWPHENELTYDYWNYRDSKTNKITVGMINEDQFFNFEKWFKKQPYYYWGDEVKSDELADDRLSAKKKIRKLLGISDDQMRELNRDRLSRKLVKKSVRARIENERIKEELAQLNNNKAENPDDLKRITLLKKNLADNNKFLENWYKEWKTFRNLKVVFDTPTVTAIQNAFNDYLDEEVKTEKYKQEISSPVLREEALKQQNSSELKIKSVLLIPASVELDRIGFNTDNPAEIVQASELAKRYHGIDFSSPEKWNQFVDENYERFDAAWFSDPLFKSKINLSQDKLKEIGFKGYIELENIRLEENIKVYNNSVAFLHASITPYGRNSGVHQRNCVCAVVESLDTLFETNYFTSKKRRWTTPNDVAQTVEKFNNKNNNFVVGKKSIGLGILAAAAGVGAFYSYQNLKLALSQDEKFDSKCVYNERKRFFDIFDAIFEQANYNRTKLNLLKYFILADRPSA